MTAEPTPRQHAEEALQSKDTLLTVLRALPVGVWILDAEGGVVFSNDVAQRIWAGVRYIGLEQLGEYKGWRTDTGKAVGAHEWAGARAIEKGETVIGEEVEIECFDGSHKFILDSAVPLLGSDGRPRGAVTINYDITPRKRAEEAVRLQADQYATLLATTTDGYWRCEPDGHLLDVNDAYCRMSGYTREELLALSVPQIEAAETPDEVARHVQRVLESGFDRFETRHRRKNGEMLDVEVSVSCCQPPGELLVFVRDITERRQNEAVNASRVHLVQFAQTHTLDELLEETLNEAERLTGSLIGFYHFVEDDQNSLTLQTWSTRTKKEFCKAEGKGMHYPIGDAGVWADAARKGKPIIHNDYAVLPNRKGMPEGHAKVIRELVVPVHRGDKLSAVLGVGNKSTAYTERDVEIVSLVADLTGEIAARKRAEEQVRAASLHARSLIEASLDPLVTISAEGKIMDVNQATERATGFARSVLIGSDFSDYFTEPDQARQAYRQALEQGFVKDYPLAIRHVSGEETDVLYNAAVFRNEAGEVQGVFAAARDITERKRAEEASRASEERFRDTLEYAAIGMALASPDGHFLDVNRAFCAITGYSRDELLKMTFADITHPDDLKVDLAEMQRLAAGKARSYQLEKRYVRKDGSMVWVLLNGSLLRGTRGRPPQIIKQVQDITPRRRAEQALQESEERYRSLVAALFEGVMLMGADGVIQASNASAEQMLGLSVEQMAQQSLLDPRWHAIHENGTPFPNETFPAWITLKTGEPCQNVIMGLHKPDGALTWLSINSQPLYRPGDAQPHAVVMSFADITERKLLEQELQRQARTDPLTGAANRRHFEVLAEQELSRARRFGHPLSILMMDIDHFKAVNDTYGHKAGDLVLQRLVEVCRHVLRDIDIVARLGGEEFVALLPETGPERARQAAERLRSAVEATEVASGPAGAIRFTVSIGVATVRDADAHTESAIARADRALYQAKETGRNRVRSEEAP